MSNVLSEAKKQQVVALGRLGWPLRRIEQETGVRRETAGAYLKAAGIGVRLIGTRWLAANHSAGTSMPFRLGMIPSRIATEEELFCGRAFQVSRLSSKDNAAVPYSNFATSGQWLWDQVALVLASGQNPYPIVEAIEKTVLEATAESAVQAEKEWQHAAHSRDMRAL
jgi:hypothetical protein